MTSVIETFRTGWRHVRGLTHDYITAIPPVRWEYSPHPAFEPLHKQVRHLVCVQGVYIDGVRNRVTDFGRKHSHYSGSLDRESLVAALRAKDDLLDTALTQITPEAEDGYLIEFYGKQTLAAYLSVIPQHEAIHHGQWSLYAAFGGFETPLSWKLNWGL